MANAGNNENREVVAYRVRKFSCDGGRQGKTWDEKFFLSPVDAQKYLKDEIAANDERNPKYPFKKESEDIDGIRSYCNWQFMIAIALDEILLKKSEGRT